MRDITNLFELENKEKDYYKPARVANIWNSSYIEYESDGDRNKRLSSEEHLNRIRPYLKDIINDPKKFDAWNIQLTIVINSMASEGKEEECVMHLKRDNKEIMINNKVDEVTEERLQSLLSRYQIGLEASIKDSDFVFDCAHLFYYKGDRINPNRGGSYIDF